MDLFYVLLAPFTLSFFLIASVQTQDVINVTFPLSPPKSSLLNVVQDNFLGVSWELSSFDTLCRSSPFGLDTWS